MQSTKPACVRNALDTSTLVQPDIPISITSNGLAPRFQPSATGVPSITILLPCSLAETNVLLLNHCVVIFMIFPFDYDVIND